MDQAVCSNCGEELSPSKAFCANCGAAVGQGVPASTDVSQTPPVQRSGGRKWIWWSAAIAVLVVVAGVAVGMTVMAQNRAAERAAQERATRLEDMRDAYEGLVVVQSATEVGVNYNDYGTRVRDAAAALAVYEAADADGEAFRAKLDEALDAYKLAGDSWATKFESYEFTAFKNFRDKHPEIKTVSSADDAVQYYWLQADLAMAEAKTALDEYGKPASK